jgi:hypothetical protein
MKWSQNNNSYLPQCKYAWGASVDWPVILVLIFVLVVEKFL